VINKPKEGTTYIGNEIVVAIMVEFGTSPNNTTSDFHTRI
jgi:hypothetical protein